MITLTKWFKKWHWMHNFGPWLDGKVTLTDPDNNIMRPVKRDVQIRICSVCNLRESRYYIPE